MQGISYLQAHMIAFAAGFIADLLIGDPHWMPHPVRWIGRLIAFLDRKLLVIEEREHQGEASNDSCGAAAKLSDDSCDAAAKPSDDSCDAAARPSDDSCDAAAKPGSDGRSPASETRKGLVLVIIVVSVTLLVSLAVMLAAYRISMAAGIAIESILTCYVLAATSLRRESMKVYKELADGDLEGARRAVSMIVGRDTAVLDEAGVTKAAVETVAENLSDGVIAPMLYTAIGGPVLGLTYKAINTMDSMIGYRNERYQWMGTAAARLDDIVNYIPARISALLLIGASAICGRSYDPARAWRIWRRDRYNHKSPNAAQTESACAGALGLKLAGDASYFGHIVKKPTIGDDIRPIEHEDIRRANRLMMAASVIGVVICLLIMIIIATA